MKRFTRSSYQNAKQKKKSSPLNFEDVEGISHNILDFLSVSNNLLIRSVNSKWKKRVELERPIELNLSVEFVSTSRLQLALPLIVSSFPEAFSIDLSGHQFDNLNPVTNIIKLYRNSLVRLKLPSCVDKPSKLGCLLCCACSVGKEQLAESLIKQGAPVDAEITLGTSLLFHLAYVKNVKMMKVLLDYGANIHELDNLHFTMLQHAALANSIEVMELLLERGSFVDKRGNFGTALTVACGIGNREAVKLLVQHKANLEIGDYDGCTPLMLAANRGDSELVQILLSAGSDKATLDDNGHNALDYAIAANQDNVLSLLK